MKKPTLDKIRLFLHSIGLKDNLVHYRREDGTCVDIQDISSSYVDGRLLCNTQDALLAIQNHLHSKPERIRDYEGITWRFTIPRCGYLSIEENSHQIRLDNGL